VGNITRLNLDIVDELQPRMASTNLLLDIRVSCMTSYLWRLLELRSGYIDNFVFSIQLAVGIDNGSADLHGWGNLTHPGRKKLTALQFPDGIERHLRDCGVHALVSPQSLENDWSQAITNSGRFSISVRQESEWSKL
jgi:hypothetical protein